MQQSVIGKRANLYWRTTPVMRYLLQAYHANSQILVKCGELDGLKSMSDISAEISKEMSAIEAEIKGFLSLQTEIKNQIAAATNDLRHRQILELRYINGLSMQELADTLGYNKRYIERVRNKALAVFEQYLIANKINYQSA